MNKRVLKPNIVRGGIAAPLGDNYYYMIGRKHNRGGIDLGSNPRTGLEVEDGEVVHVSDNNVKVFSSLPFLNGESPAQKVMNGENPNKVFNEQEQFKDRNGIEDDGSKKKKAEWGIDDNTINTAETVASFFPVIGTAIDIKDAIKNPSLSTIGQAGLSLAADLSGLSLLRGGIKAIKYANKAKRASRELDKLMPLAKKADRLIKTGNPKKIKIGNEINKPFSNKLKEYTDYSNKAFVEKTYKDRSDLRAVMTLLGDATINTIDKTYGLYNNKKYKAGGLYSITNNGKTSLHQFPSTGKASVRSTDVRRKAAAGTKNRLINGLMLLDKDYKDYIDNEGRLKPFTIEYDEPAFTGTDSQKKAAISNFNKTLSTERDNALKDIRLNSNNYTLSDNNRSFRQRITDFINNKPNTVSDVASLTANALGSIISHGINNSMLKDLKYTAPPVARPTVKLKTRININPQLDKMRESLSTYERTIDNNTASSNVALARKQRSRLANVMQTNELYGNRENAETELINRDRLNRQNIINANVRDYNTWRKEKTAFENAVREKQSENDISLVDNINLGIQNTITNNQKRRAENQTIAAMALANPDLPVEVLHEQGLINDRTYNAYRKAYRLRRINNA